MATTDKYDRQLRLWGPRGQARLAGARVVCLGSSAVATETLKNLVLPGLGRLLIIDDARVTESDLGQNFFLEESDLGRYRAEAVLEHLLSLNPDVTGEFSTLPISDLSETDVLAVFQESMDTADSLVEKFPAAKIVVVNVAGFVASVRLFGRDLEIVDSRPEEGSRQDLRLANPFPALREFSDSIDLAALSDAEHGHIPWVVLLLKARRGTLADTRAELARLRRSDDQMNFSEALENVHLAFPQIDLDLGRVEGSGEFWAMKRTVAEFVRKYSCLPLSGALPDMTADTNTFLKLQAIYRDQAQVELKLVKELLEEEVSDEYVEYFCKFAGDAVGLTLSSPMRIDLESDEIKDELNDKESLLKWYVAMNEKHLVVSSQLSAEIAHERQELERYAGCELHACSAVIGGVTAQEIIKLITRIFTPMDNLFLFDGTRGVGQTLKV